MRRKLTEGKAPPHTTGFIVSRSHCCMEEGKGNNTSRGQRDTQGRGEYLLTSSALETQRGSSMPISHWCRAAIVNAASRRDLGTHVPSKSAMAPPASSKSHADT